MDLTIFCFLATVLLVTVQAGPTDQGPQMFTEDKPAEPKQKQHKREPKYEVQMKEVILYLTPSQIRALEAGKGLTQPQQTAQPDLTAVNEQIKEQMGNMFNAEAQKLQQDKQNEEARREKPAPPKAPKQSKQPPKKTKEQQLAPENNAPQSPQSELQKREKFIELPLHFHLTPHFQQKAPPQYLPQAIPHALPASVPYLEHQVLQSQAESPRVEPKEVPTSQVAEPQDEKVAIPLDKTYLPPQNYAYFYIYPQGKPETTAKSKLFYSHEAKQWHVAQEERPKPVLEQSYPELPIFPHHPRFQLVPYEYGHQNNLEAQHILQAQLQEHELNAHNLEAFNLESHRLEPHQLEIDAQDLLAHKELEAQYLQYGQPHKLQGYEGQTAEKMVEQQVEAGRLEAGYEGQTAEKMVEQQVEAGRLEAGYEGQTAEKMVEQQVEAGRLEAQNSKTPANEADLKPAKSAESELDIDELHFRRQMDEIIEARKLKAKLEAQEQEAMRLDAQLEVEQRKAEKMRQEQERLAFLRQLEPKRSQMHTILNPLFQGHNIAESLEKQKANFPHNRINIEKGFRPLLSADSNSGQYAPEYNNEKYRSEVEKILKRNRVEKQKALEKAAAIANEPPEYFLTTKEEAPKGRQSVEMFKHVSIPTPVFVPVPEPFEVKVPQPYPVPLEIIRPIPIPIVKMEKVEVEKPVPVEVEKRVPVPVTKNVYIQVDKPYFVEKVVPVEVRKKIPVEIPIRKPQKLSIIRHVWEH